MSHRLASETQCRTGQVERHSVRQDKMRDTMSDRSESELQCQKDQDQKPDRPG